MSENNIQEKMQEFLNLWTKAGKPITEEWYETFRDYVCPNTVSIDDACNTGYCPVGETECCRLVDYMDGLSDPKKWWLISNEDVQAIKKGLTGSLLHTLESGLHITYEVPEDWKYT